MAKVSLDKLKPGMRLTKPVENDAGMVLIGEGTELTEATIRRLDAMNISSVHVDVPTAGEKPKEELLAALEARFSKTGNAPHMQTILKVFRQHIEETAS